MKNIYTKRLVLRMFSVDDAKSLYNLVKDRDIGDNAGWPYHKSVLDSKNIIENVLIKDESYAICKKDNTLIGAISLKNIKPNISCELGYWIGKYYWNNGYCTEAARALLSHAFCDCNMQMVYCDYFDGNLSSKRVQEKLGFIYQHTENKFIFPLNTTKLTHVNILTREDFLENNY